MLCHLSFGSLQTGRCESLFSTGFLQATAAVLASLNSCQDLGQEGCKLQLGDIIMDTR